MLLLRLITIGAFYSIEERIVGIMETVRFDDLDLNDEILRAVKEMGFEEASPIQAKAIPVVLSGRDLVGQAQTGTGKTAAFGIPMLQMLDTENKRPQAMILCPTRELAIQVSDEIRRLAKFMHGAKVLPIYGGQNITNQIRAIKKGVNIIVGTPGRVMDHLRRHTLKTEDLKMVILDEADEMLNMGFREDIETILHEMPENRQTLLFSATMPKAIMELRKKYQDHAKVVKIVKKELTVSNIEQSYFEVRSRRKLEVLCRLLDMYTPKLSVVFCNTKRKADEVAEQLKGRGYFAEGLHGDLKQSQRDRVMKSFRNGRVDILVATDVAARGIDVDDVDAVFNYDLPQDDEFYVHRIGRTGRAGRTGSAFTFVERKERRKLKEIMRYCRTKISERPIPSLQDVQNIKSENLMSEINGMIKEEEMEKYISLMNDFVEESPYSALEIAAAFLKKSLKDTSLEETAEMWEDTGAEKGMARLFINVGKKNGVRPGDILGAVAGESNISGELVGAIDMHDKYSFVEVPRAVAADVLCGMKRAKIKGKTISMEPANKRA